MKILIAAGGTGGHLLPAQQLAAMLQGEILFAGHKLEASPFFQRDRFAFAEIDSAPPKARALFRFFVETAKGFWQSVRLIRRVKPDVVVGFGSFHSFPVLLAALCLRKKIALFEANCLLGKVNRFFAPFASVASQFSLQRKSSVLVPLLPWKEMGRPPSKQEARARYGLEPDAPTLLIFGGSQGASFFNRTLPAVLRGKNLQVIHLAGNAQAASDVEAAYGEVGARAAVRAFENDMPAAYAAADIAVCRSGASTIAELIRFAMPALLIPYPFAMDDHQRINGEFLAKKEGAARMQLERFSTPENLAGELAALLEQAALLRERLQHLRSECEGRKHFSEWISNL